MIKFKGSIGTNDNDVVLTTQELNGDYNEVTFHATAGAITVQGMINGTWSGDLAIQPLQTTTPNTYVLTTGVATSFFRLHGKYQAIRFLQDGATPANVEGVIA